MKPSAVLLVDLENFVLSRFDHFNDENIRSEDRPSFTEDLKNLVRYATRMAGLPLAVRRAYADFESLRVDAQDLMRQGVEPVQVFRLSGKSANKNAADMKLAMDAVSLLDSGGNFEHFVLVSGDADFIPVILELKRRGHTVSVIAVTGATNELIQQFVDNFELFEDLVSAEGAKPRGRVVTPDELLYVATALRKLLNRSRPVRFNMVQPLLSKELGYTFDSGIFGCNSAGEFLRKHCAALGIVVRGTHNEQEIDLPGVPAPSANGTNGTKPVARSGPRTTPAERATPAPSHEPHSSAHYKHLLASGRADANEARVLPVPWASLVWVCDAVIPALTPPTGRPATSMELMSWLQTDAKTTGVPDLAAHVTLIHATVRCSLPVPPVPGGAYSLPADATGEQIRNGVLRYTVYVLGCRLSENGVKGPIRPESVAAMFDPGPHTEQATAEARAALAAAVAEPALVAPAPPPVTPAKPVARADENHIHTPDGYRRLLQKGGPKNSGDSEHMRVHTTPWPSVVRVCADAFDALSPAGTTMQRGQFLERLYAAEQEMCADNYRSHVRRAFTLLGVSHAILEDGDRVTLHPEVAEPGDIRWAVLGTMLKLVAIRLEEKGVANRVQPDVFVAAIEAGPFTDEMLPEITRAIEDMYLTADGSEPEPVTVDLAPEPEAQPATGADDTPEPVPVDDAEANANAVATVEPANEAAVPQAEPMDWDQFAFDGSLPEYSTTASAVAEPYPAHDPTAAGALGIDVAVLTDAAVATVVEPAVQVIAVSEPASTTETVPPPEAVSELVVFAPPLVIEAAPGPQQPAPPVDKIPLESPDVDWLDDDSILSVSGVPVDRVAERLTGSSTRLAPLTTTAPYADDDSVFSDSEFSADRITERLTGSSAQLAPLMPLPAETRMPVTKISLPQLHAPHVPPPSPPESA